MVNTYVKPNEASWIIVDSLKFHLCSGKCSAERIWTMFAALSRDSRGDFLRRNREEKYRFAPVLPGMGSARTPVCLELIAKIRGLCCIDLKSRYRQSLTAKRIFRMLRSEDVLEIMIIWFYPNLAKYLLETCGQCYFQPSEQWIEYIRASSTVCWYWRLLLRYRRQPEAT